MRSSRIHLSAEVGGTVSLEAPSLSAAGYVWRLDTNDADAWRLMERTIEGELAFGVARKIVWKVKVVAPRYFTISAVRFRPWEAEPAEIIVHAIDATA